MGTVAESAGTRLAVRLGFGALVLIAAAWLFGGIAEDVVTGDRLTLLDGEVAQWLHRHATPSLTAWMLAVTHLHSTVAVTIYTLLAAAFLWRRRAWRTLATVVTCMAGGLLLNVLMKLAFHRARPVFEEPLLTLTTYSFPSGHVAGSTILYGLAVAWVFGHTRRGSWRLIAVAAAFAAIVLVAFSRMYLGVHYLSDVAAAFAEGVAWLALCLSAFAAFWREAPTVAGAGPSPQSQSTSMSTSTPSPGPGPSR